jgi:hypothetical protein
MIYIGCMIHIKELQSIINEIQGYLIVFSLEKLVEENQI